MEIEQAPSGSADDAARFLAALPDIDVAVDTLTQSVQHMFGGGGGAVFVAVSGGNELSTTRWIIATLSGICAGCMETGGTEPAALATKLQPIVQTYVTDSAWPETADPSTALAVASVLVGAIASAKDTRHGCCLFRVMFKDALTCEGTLQQLARASSLAVSFEQKGKHCGEVAACSAYPHWRTHCLQSTVQRNTKNRVARHLCDWVHLVLTFLDSPATP